MGQENNELREMQCTMLLRFDALRIEINYERRLHSIIEIGISSMEWKRLVKMTFYDFYHLGKRNPT